MTRPRGALAVVLWKDHIYAIGGHDGNSVQSSVEYTVVNPNGSLDTWQTTTSLGQARYALAAVAAAGRIYAVGGIDMDPVYGKNDLAVVESTVVNPNHSLQSWTITTPMPTARGRLALIIWQNQIYALGGSHTNSPLDTVEQSTIQQDGSLGAWQPAGGMTSMREGLAAVVWGNYIYAIGGRDYDSVTGFHALKSIERAEISANGTLGAWQMMSPMQVSRYAPAAVIVGNYLCVLGGSNADNGGTDLNSVEIATINPDGSLGNWQFAIPMISPRLAFGAVQTQNNLYAVGGTTSTGILASVERTGNALNTLYLFLPVVLK
ncbi:MAG TPA: hypothetical protein VF932_09340 [Anaerolineae bacterium]